MTITIHVTQRHIDRGIGRKSDGCAIAIAVNEHIPTCEAHVAGGGPQGLLLVPLLPGHRNHCLTLPESAKLFVQAFDIFHICGHIAPQLKPFKFEIDVADELLPAEPTRVASPPMTYEQVTSEWSFGRRRSYPKETELPPQLIKPRP